MVDIIFNCEFEASNGWDVWGMQMDWNNCGMWRCPLEKNCCLRSIFVIKNFSFVIESNSFI